MTTHDVSMLALLAEACCADPSQFELVLKVVDKPSEALRSRIEVLRVVAKKAKRAEDVEKVVKQLAKEDTAFKRSIVLDVEHSIRWALQCRRGAEAKRRGR